MSASVTAEPRTIIALGGGFSIDEDDRMDRYVLSHVVSERPKVCFVPTASGDSERYVLYFHRAMAKLGCEASDLKLFGRDQSDLREHLLSQDVIYVGGGNTANLLAVWRLHGVDSIMREAYEAGVLLCGISAGVNCWFESCSTDSFGDFRSLPDGLGFLKGSFCPHYNTEAERQKLYSQAIREREIPPGLALDDGAAVRFIDGEVNEVVVRGEDVGLYQVDGESVVRWDRLIPCD